MSSLRQVLAFRLTLLVVVIPLVFHGAAWAQEATTLATSAADATIDQANPNTNFGSGASLGSSGGASVVQRSVVRFDLSSLANQGVAVKAATLNMILTDPPAATRTIEVHNLTTPFTEGTVTYNSPWTTAGGDFGASLRTAASGTTRGGTVSWADSGGVLAAAVQGWFTSNTGFLLKDATETTNSPPAITHVQTVTGATTTGNTVASGSITAQDGNVYVAAIGLSNAGGRSVTGISGPPGLTWSSLTGQLSDDFLHRVEFWTSSGTPTANGAVTATVSGASGAQSIVVSRYTGVNPDSPIGASAQTLSSGAATAVSLVLSTLTNNSIPLGATGEVAASATPGAAYTEDGDTGATTEGVELERHTAAVATPQAVTVNATLSSAQHWSMIAAELVQEMAPRWGSRESTGNTPSLALTYDRAPTGMTMTASPAPGISEVTLNWGFGGACGNNSVYRGSFFSQATPGNTNSTVPPADGTAFPVLGSTLPSGDVVVFESGNACTVTTTLENGPDVSILPGQSNSVMGFAFDNQTIAGAAVTAADHYSRGLAVSGTTNSASSGTKLWSYKTAATTFAAPGLTGSGVIVTAGNDSKLHSMSSSTGGRNYRPGTVVGTDPGALGGAVQSRPPVIPRDVLDSGNPCANTCDVVYVGAGDGRVYAFRTDTGAQLWQSAVLVANASIQGAPAVQLLFYSTGLAQDTVVVGTHCNTCATNTANNQIIGLNGDSGAVLWRCGTNLPSPGATACGNMDIISSTPAVDYATNNVWVTSRSNGGTQPSIYRVNTTNGDKVAAITLAGGNSTNVDASPSLSYGNSGGASSPPVFAYILTGNSAGTGDLRVIDPSTNTQVVTTALTGAGFANTFPLPFFDGTVAGCDDVYFTTGGTTKQVHRRTFKRATPVGFGAAPCSFANNSWDATVGTTPSTPIDNGFPSPSALFVGSTDGLIHKIATSNGAAVSTVTVNAGSQLGDISTDGSNLYIGDAAGRIYAFPTF